MRSKSNNIYRLVTSLPRYLGGSGAAVIKVLSPVFDEVHQSFSMGLFTIATADEFASGREHRSSLRLRRGPPLNHGSSPPDQKPHHQNLTHKSYSCT